MKGVRRSVDMKRVPITVGMIEAAVCAYAGENWRELVPNSVANFIEEIEGDTRLRELNKPDTVD